MSSFHLCNYVYGVSKPFLLIESTDSMIDVVRVYISFSRLLQLVKLRYVHYPVTFMWYTLVHAVSASGIY